MATSTDTREYFFSSLREIFSKWTALKLVEEHGMARKEQVHQFCVDTAEYIYKTRNLDNIDLAEFLNDYMDDMFNTELEDNSAIQVATELLEQFSKVPLVKAPEEIEAEYRPPTSICFQEDKDMNIDEAAKMDEWITVERQRKKPL